ncbi:DUF7827 domain-containing protein [Halorussus litoreus]|uniref:DUF7827 domain-containing protein n=1 Tax=Halorussus litoreus TaxID=1710536 RepID=UPI000E25544D|nr:BGTF surface domain-containing protein [Halorussus litoreus]
MTSRRAGSLIVVVGVLLASVAAPVGPALAAADTAEFDPTIVSVRQGETGSIGISIPETANDSYRLALGSRDDELLVRATVRDADGDGSITVDVDTRTAGEGDPGASLDVSDGDALRNATQVTPENDPSRPLPAGTYDLNLTTGGELVTIGTLVVSGPYVSETETPETSEADGRETTTVRDTGTNFVYEGEAITLRAGLGQTVRGETTLDAGTEVTVRLRSPEHNFLRAKEVTVSESGAFAATFDMGGVDPDATFGAHVHQDGTILASADGRVVDCSEGCEQATTTDENGDATTTLPADEIAAQSVVEVTRAKTARIPVTFGDAEALTVSIGGPAVNYVVTGTVRDSDGDGRAVVRFHTDTAGFDAPTLSSSDDLRQNDESSLSATLAAGSYPVKLYGGQNATGEPATVGRLVVYEAGTSPSTETTETLEATETLETTEDPSTPTRTTVGSVDRSTPSDVDDRGRLLGGFGMIAVGGVLAVVGIGVLLGLFRR